MSGGGGDLFGTILNVVSFAVPALRPVAIGFNMINAAANDNPLGMLTSAAGAYGAFGDASIAADAAANVDPSWAAGDAFSAASDAAANVDPSWLAGDSYSALSDAASNVDPSWSGTVFEGAPDAQFLGSEGLQTAVDANPNAWKAIVGDTVTGFDQSLTAPMSPQGLGILADNTIPMAGMAPSGIPSSSDFGAPTQAFEAGTSENVFNPSTDGYSMGDFTGDTEPTRTTLEGVADDRFSGGDPFATTVDVNKGYNGVTGYGIGNGYGKGMTGLPIGTENSMGNVLSKIGGGGNAQPMSPLMMGLKGFGALDSLIQGKKSQNFLERQFNAANNWTDPNRARGDVANQMWQQNYQDPRTGYNEFMTGAGREFTDQARAQAAKSGRRGGYLNSGRMQSDLASLFMKNQLARGNALSQGFAGGQNNYAASASAAPGYAAMLRNQNAPIFDMLGELEKNRGLSSLFGGE